MLKELTINVEEDVYDALRPMAENQRVWGFLADILRKAGKTGDFAEINMSGKKYPPDFDIRLTGAASPDLYGKGEVLGDIIGPFHEEWGDV